MERIFEDRFIDLLGKLDDRYVTIPFDEDLAKQIERGTSVLNGDDNQTEQNNKA